MTVGRFVSRASSTAQFTATVVVPAPPLAPRNTCVTHGCRAPAVRGSRRAPSAAPRRGTTPPSCATPASRRRRSTGRTRWRRRASPGGSARARLRPRSRRSPSPGCAARSRSMAAMPGRRVAADVDDDEVGPRRSAPGRRSSRMPTGTPHARSSARDLALELFVVADDRCCELCHGSSTERAESLGERAVGVPGRPCRRSRRSA